MFHGISRARVRAAAAGVALALTGARTASAGVIDWISTLKMMTELFSSTDEMRKALQQLVGPGGTGQFVVPQGTIVAYAGNWNTTVHGDGWRPCNGERVHERSNTGNSIPGDLEPSQFESLRAAIGSIWGPEGTDGQTGRRFLTLPDLRGYFIRGASVGHPVGRTQEDSLQEHLHDSPENGMQQYWTYSSPGGSASAELVTGASGMRMKGATYTGGVVDKQVVAGDGQPNDPRKARVGNETRPVNRSVNYLMKVK